MTRHNCFTAFVSIKTIQKCLFSLRISSPVTTERNRKKQRPINSFVEIKWKWKKEFSNTLTLWSKYVIWMTFLNLQEFRVKRTYDVSFFLKQSKFSFKIHPNTFTDFNLHFNIRTLKREQKSSSVWEYWLSCEKIKGFNKIQKSGKTLFLFDPYPLIEIFNWRRLFVRKTLNVTKPSQKVGKVWRNFDRFEFLKYFKVDRRWREGVRQITFVFEVTIEVWEVRGWNGKRDETVAYTGRCWFALENTIW